MRCTGTTVRSSERVWGGHSCPPLLNLLCLDLIKTLTIRQEPKIKSKSKIKVKSGGQECPPHIQAFCYHRILVHQQDMDDEIPSIMVPAEEYMEVSSMPSGGSRRNEDIALDLMKFIAMTTGYGKTTSSGVGFQGGGAAAKPEEYAGHLLELYGRCLEAVQAKK
jgi:hypothetical protein